MRHRRRARQPRIASELVTTPADRREFLYGAELLRFYGPRARAGHRPQPQQLVVADCLAAGRQRNAVLLPRRSSKSTSLIAVALGRAAHREDYRVGILTLTSGKAGRSRFLKDVVPALESLHRDPKSAPFKIVKSAGQERVEFPDTGGMVAWLSSVDDLRGEAFDLIILDEAGEPDPDKVADVLAAAMPTLDTRPGAQIVVAGTAGKYRKGNLLWDWLEMLRTGSIGGIEYSVDEFALTDEEWLDWENVRPLITDAHPGIGTLTTLEAVHGNWQTLKPETFRAEYGGIFGDIGGGRALINPDDWEAAGTDDPLPQPPARFTVGFAAHVNQSCSTIVAAWRDENGRAVGGILARTKGVAGAAERLHTLVKKYDPPIVYDDKSGPGRVEVEKLDRARPEPRLVKLDFNALKTAHALLVQEIHTGNLTHYRQTELDAAARVAIRRPAGNGWLFGRTLDEDDVTPLEAFAMALKAWDDAYGRPRVSLPPMVVD